ENPLSGEVRLTSSAYLTFVALDEEGRPATVPALQPETPDERRREAQGRERSAARRARRKKGRPGG
ncbi:MAG: acyl-CoA thioesterase, partial [Planctomycetota bacterium]